MKEKNIRTCPGCRRHCPENAVSCKFGRKYFAKRQEHEANMHLAVKSSPNGRKYKWEAYVTGGSPIWALLTTGRKVKKALRSKRVTERQILGCLDEQEKAQLKTLLEKLSAAAGPEV